MSREVYKEKFRRFSGISRRQLGVFMVSGFSFVVSFSWNAFTQNLFQTVVPSNAKNSASLYLVLQLLYALLITLIGAVVIAFIYSRPQRSPDTMTEIRSEISQIKEILVQQQQQQTQ